MPRRWARLTGSLVACAYFWTQCVFLHAQESGFWAERKAAARRMAGDDSPPDGRSGLSSTQHQLLAQLPGAGQVAFDVAESASVGAGLALTPASAGPASLDLSAPSAGSPAWISNLILPYGSIREIHLAKRPGAPIVIHIQDAHGIEEAQRNMAAMIQGLRESRGVDLVGLEGASGAFNLAPYRDWPDAAVTRDIAGYFLKEGKIGGPEFAGITAPRPPTLWGVEDAGLYLDNVKALRESFKEKPAMMETLAGLKSAAASLKDAVYSPGLKEFDRHFLAYQDQKEGLGAYVRYLVRTEGIASSRKTLLAMTAGGAGRGKDGGFPNVEMLVRALAAEDALDFKQVERERLELVETLSRRLSREKLDLLVQRSFQYRAGRTGYGDYYRFLETLCRENGVPLGGHLTAYIAYVVLAEKIDRNALLDELSRLEKGVQEGLAATPEQKRLVAVSRRLGLLEKLSAQAMTPEDWGAYQAERGGVLRVAADISDLETALSAPHPALRAAFPQEGKENLGVPSREGEGESFESLLRPFEEFCRAAVGRNGAFVERLTERMEKQGASAAVLVAGGFHSEGLTRLFREKDLSYVVVTPKITEVPKDGNYLDVFARDPLPLEKLFSGEKLFLRYDVLTGPGMPGFRADETRFHNQWNIAESVSQAGRMAGDGPLTEDVSRSISKATEKAAAEMGDGLEVLSLGKNGRMVRENVDLNGDQVADVDAVKEGKEEPQYRRHALTVGDRWRMLRNRLSPRRGDAKSSSSSTARSHTIAGPSTGALAADADTPPAAAIGAVYRLVEGVLLRPFRAQGLRGPELEAKRQALRPVIVERYVPWAESLLFGAVYVAALVLGPVMQAGAPWYVSHYPALSFGVLNLLFGLAHDRVFRFVDGRWVQSEERAGLGARLWLGLMGAGVHAVYLLAAPKVIGLAPLLGMAAVATILVALGAAAGQAHRWHQLLARRLGLPALAGGPGEAVGAGAEKGARIDEQLLKNWKSLLERATAGEDVSQQDYRESLGRSGTLFHGGSGMDAGFRAVLSGLFYADPGLRRVVLDENPQDPSSLMVKGVAERVERVAAAIAEKAGGLKPEESLKFSTLFELDDYATARAVLDGRPDYGVKIEDNGSLRLVRNARPLTPDEAELKGLFDQVVKGINGSPYFELHGDRKNFTFTEAGGTYRVRGSIHSIGDKVSFSVMRKDGDDLSDAEMETLGLFSVEGEDAGKRLLERRAFAPARTLRGLPHARWADAEVTAPNGGALVVAHAESLAERLPDVFSLKEEAPPSRSTAAEVRARMEARRLARATTRETELFGERKVWPAVFGVGLAAALAFGGKAGAFVQIAGVAASLFGLALAGLAYFDVGSAQRVLGVLTSIFGVAGAFERRRINGNWDDMSAWARDHFTPEEQAVIDRFTASTSQAPSDINHRSIEMNSVVRRYFDMMALGHWILKWEERGGKYGSLLGMGGAARFVFHVGAHSAQNVIYYLVKIKVLPKGWEKLMLGFTPQRATGGDTGEPQDVVSMIRKEIEEAVRAGRPFGTEDALEILDLHGLGDTFFAEAIADLGQHPEVGLESLGRLTTFWGLPPDQERILLLLMQSRTQVLSADPRRQWAVEAVFMAVEKAGDILRTPPGPVPGSEFDALLADFGLYEVWLHIPPYNQKILTMVLRVQRRGGLTASDRGALERLSLSVGGVAGPAATEGRFTIIPEGASGAGSAHATVSLRGLGIRNPQDLVLGLAWKETSEASAAPAAAASRPEKYSAWDERRRGKLRTALEEHSSAWQMEPGPDRNAEILKTAKRFSSAGKRVPFDAGDEALLALGLRLDAVSSGHHQIFLTTGLVDPGYPLSGAYLTVEWTRDDGAVRWSVWRVNPRGHVPLDMAADFDSREAMEEALGDRDWAWAHLVTFEEDRLSGEAWTLTTGGLRSFVQEDDPAIDAALRGKGFDPAGQEKGVVAQPLPEGLKIQWGFSARRRRWVAHFPQEDLPRFIAFLGLTPKPEGGPGGLRSFVGSERLSLRYLDLFWLVKKAGRKAAEEAASVLRGNGVVGVEAAHFLDGWRDLTARASVEGFQVALFEALRAAAGKKGAAVDASLDGEVRDVLKGLRERVPGFDIGKVVYTDHEDEAMADPGVMTLPAPVLERNRADAWGVATRFALHEGLEVRLGHEMHNALIALGFDEKSALGADGAVHLAREMMIAADAAGVTPNDRAGFARALADRYKLTGDRAVMRALMTVLSPEARPVGWDVRRVEGVVAAPAGEGRGEAAWADLLDRHPQEVLRARMREAGALGVDAGRMAEDLLQGAKVGVTLPDLGTGEGRILDMGPLFHGGTSDGGLKEHLERVLAAIEARGRAKGLGIGAAGVDKDLVRRILAGRLGAAAADVLWVDLPVEGGVMRAGPAARAAKEKDPSLSSLTVVTPLAKESVDLVRGVPDGVKMEHERLTLGDIVDRALKALAEVLEAA